MGVGNDENHPQLSYSQIIISFMRHYFNATHSDSSDFILISWLRNHCMPNFTVENIVRYIKRCNFFCSTGIIGYFFISNDLLGSFVFQSNISLCYLYLKNICIFQQLIVLVHANNERKYVSTSIHHNDNLNEYLILGEMTNLRQLYAYCVCVCVV